MTATKNVMNSLPLLAAVLGKRYGVKITQGGDTAYSDGSKNVVNLPALTVQSDEETLALVRGYIDHEAGGHLRHTNFNALYRAKLDPRTMSIWNAIEDWRVEAKLSEIYPGCKANLAWLVRKFFVDEWGIGSGQKESLPFEYVLLTCRSWSIPEVSGNLGRTAAALSEEYPGLKGEIDGILARTKACCPDTKAAIAYAQEISEAVQKRIPPQPPRQQNQNPSNKGAKGQGGGRRGRPSPEQTESFLPQGLGDRVRDALGVAAMRHTEIERTGVASPIERKVLELFPDEYHDALRTSAGLRARLAGTMQAKTLRKVAPGRHGRLDGKSLYKLFVGDPKVFRRDSEALGVDTAVHLLVDVSGSMTGSGIRTARQAAYALAVALGGVKGVSLGVTTFPGGTWDRASVTPILAHGERIHKRFAFEANGSTPLSEALLWTLQTLTARQEPRKLIFVITDGCPDNPITCRATIAEASRLGVETYGIGIETDTVESLFPKKSIVVQSLGELTPKLFRLMQDVLVRNV